MAHAANQVRVAVMSLPKKALAGLPAKKDVEDVYTKLVRSLAPARLEAPSFAAEVSTVIAFIETAHEWNERLDLSGARTMPALVEILLADALMLASTDLVHQGETFLDIGSGAGGPALALAIVRPDLRGTLVEPKGKRVAFLRNCTGSLGLAERVTVVEGRVEPKRPLPMGTFDVALSRATFDPAIWARVGLMLAPEALVMLAQDELAPGYDVLADVRYVLPSNGANRRIARIRKRA